MLGVTPLVGITTYPPNAAGRYELPQEYVAAVRRAGATPVLLPPGEDRLEELVGRLDGIVLAGGGDVEPSRYGGADHPELQFVNPDRDEIELRLVHQVVDEGIPTLAVCRGVQVVNVAFGGTLHAHLPEVVGDAVTHRKEPKWHHPHAIEADEGSLLASIMGTTTAEPAAWHHQAVDRPGHGLAVTAWAPDGVIEAVELPGHPWLVGVQWHPEITAADDPSQQALFDGLVEAIRGRDS
jgi:putative glutamine amidotransferase